MKDLFVSYEQATQLKELGFNEPCFGYYYTLNGKDWKFVEKTEFSRLDDEINIGYKFSLLVPLKQQVLRWFREKYNIIGLIEGGFDMTNIFTYCIWEGFKDKIYDDYYGTYEDAEDVLINILIDKVKNK
jgi:hypothetical protein